MRRLIWLGGIVLIAFALRLYEINTMALRADEASVVLLSAQNPEAIIRPFVTSDPHLPLSFLILHFWMLAAGSMEIAVRFPTVFAGVLLVPLVYGLGKLVFPRREATALLAAFFVAINPFLIWDAQDVYMYSLLTVFAAGSFILFLRVLEPHARKITWAGYIIVSALGLYFHYFSAFILLAQGGVALYLSVRREIGRKVLLGWLIALGVICLIFLPWVIWAWGLLAGFRSDFIPAASLFEILNRALLAFTVGRVDTRMAPAVVDAWSGNLLALGFLILWLAGLLGAARKANENEARGRIVLLMYLAVPLLAFFVFSIVRFPIFDERYVLYLAPAFVLILARGIVSLETLTGRRWVSAAALAYVVLASSHSLFNYYYVPEFAKSPDWQGLVRQLTSDSLPGDVIIQNYPDPALPYYLQNRVPRILLPRAETDTADAVAADLDRITGKYTRLWLQPVPGGAWDNNALVQTWFNRHARLVKSYPFRGVNLALYIPATGAIANARPVGAVIGEIKLEAFEWDESAAQLVLYWRAIERIGTDTTVFVHLHDTQGKLLAQQDNPPVQGTYATSEWTPGQVVVDSYHLEIAPAALKQGYTLVVGMYDAQTQQRSSAFDATGKPYPENGVLLVNSAEDGAR